MKNYLAIGFSSILYGTIILFNFLQLTRINQEETFSIILIFFGILTFVNGFHKLKRSGLFLTSVMMNIGVVLFVLTNYEILNWSNVVTPSLFYIVGAGLIVLYIENTSEYVFLFSAILFLCLALCSVVLVGDVGVFSLINSITLILFDYWPLFLILIGVMFIFGSQNRKLSSVTSTVDTSE